MHRKHFRNEETYFQGNTDNNAKFNIVNGNTNGVQLDLREQQKILCNNLHVGNRHCPFHSVPTCHCRKYGTVHPVLVHSGWLQSYTGLELLSYNFSVWWSSSCHRALASPGKKLYHMAVFSICNVIQHIIAHFQFSS